MVILVGLGFTALWFWGRGSIVGGMLMTPPLVYLGLVVTGVSEITEQAAAICVLQACIGICGALLGAWVPYMFHKRQTQLTGSLSSISALRDT